VKQNLLLRKKLNASAESMMGVRMTALRIHTQFATLFTRPRGQASAIAAMETFRPGIRTGSLAP
jgi:hypothetical protein